MFFASTRQALEVTERTLRASFVQSGVAEGTLIALARGRIVAVQRFGPDRSHVDRPLPAVRAADEGAACRERLAALVRAAA